jgi:hypothetical protein
MKRFWTTALAAGVFAAVAMAETFSGTLMDVMCKGKDPVAHTRECAINCAKSGLGLVTADGKFLKFDAAGNKTALDVLKKSTKEKDLKATVTGTLNGDTIQVTAVELK